MTDLAPRPDLLAVEMHLHPGVGREQVVQPLVDRHPAGFATEHVGHHHRRRGRAGVAQRVVQYRPQVLLELRGTGTFDGPVAGVVRAHRQLVDEQAGPGLEQLDGEQADHAQLVGEPDGQPLRFDGARRVEVRRRCQYLDADPVALHRFHDGVHGDLAERRRRLPDDALPDHHAEIAAPDAHMPQTAAKEDAQ